MRQTRTARLVAARAAMENELAAAGPRKACRDLPVWTLCIVQGRSYVYAYSHMQIDVPLYKNTAGLVFFAVSKYKSFPRFFDLACINFQNIEYFGSIEYFGR